MGTIKFTKKFWIGIGIGIVIIALAALGMTAFQQVTEKNQLTRKLVSSRSQLQGLQLDSLSAKQAELENRLSQTIPELESLKARLSQPVSSNSTANVLVDAAKTYGLIVTGMTSTSPTAENVEGANLVSISVSVKVEGSVSKLVNYASALNNLLKTSAITSVEITVPETTNVDKASATIQLVIYTYRGD